MIPIAHHENRYKINDQGVILNLASNQLLKPTRNPNGYLKVGLANGDGTHDQQLVHILTAKHFIPNPYGYTQINHKNGVKEDCTASNLEWCTSQQNIEHAFKTGLRPGYMSADDKEKYLHQILNGKQVNDLAIEIGRRAETLHKMLRETALRLGIKDLWTQTMRNNRRASAIRNLTKKST